VLELIEFFLERAANRLQRPRVGLSDDARELLSRYRWPGNVRELENLITRACVLSAGGAIEADDLRPWLEPTALAANDTASATTSASELAGARLDDLERATIVATLQKFGGNRAQTAAALGIGVRTLSGKLRAYGFAPRAREFSLPTTNEHDRSDRQKLPMAAANPAGWETRRSA
jgi:DNA-binding NtrC family response regulator